MMMKYSKPKVWLPIFLGVLIAGLLFLMGENDDAPGLVLIGFIVATISVFLGIYNAASETKKGFVPAILCFFLAVFGAVWTIILYFEGEFADTPGIIIFSAIICFGLLAVGIRLLKGREKK